MFFVANNRLDFGLFARAIFRFFKSVVDRIRRTPYFLRFNETHLSTLQTRAKASFGFFEPDPDKSGQGDFGPPQANGTETFNTKNVIFKKAWVHGSKVYESTLASMVEDSKTT